MTDPATIIGISTLGVAVVIIGAIAFSKKTRNHHHKSRVSSSPKTNVHQSFMPLSEINLHKSVMPLERVEASDKVMTCEDKMPPRFQVSVGYGHKKSRKSKKNKKK